MFPLTKNKTNAAISDVHLDLDKKSHTITIIGSGTKLEGNIECKGDLRVEGEVNGNVHSDSKIVIAPSGKIWGNLKAVQADIAGKIHGDVKVGELLQLKGAAQIQGDIFAQKLLVEPTVVFAGQCFIGKMNAVPESKVYEKAETELYIQ